MFVTLYTSRVILDALGVKDYGIYNVVAGFVMMISMISAPLSLSIGRFITFELGKGNLDKLQRIFSTSVNIQLLLSLLLVFLGETIGLWFLNTQIVIPEGRYNAAFWVYQCAMIELTLNLLNIPYNAAIIAHEKMSAFAYISVIEGLLKLSVALFIYISLWDKLIVYAILLVLVSVLLRVIYIYYCYKHFNETRYILVYDKSLLKEMINYAGWNFISNIAVLLNTQGVNILFNIFFGVTTNAARGIASRVEVAVNKFATDFTTAINPQIIKQYASGNMDVMIKYICQGAKFSYFLILLFALPLIYEIEEVLSIWLVEVPEHTDIFIRLSIIGSSFAVIGNSSSTAIHATGKIKMYTIVITMIIGFVFPLSWLAYKFGAPVETSYYIFILFYFIAFIARLLILKKLIDFPFLYFIRTVFSRIVIVTILTQLVPIIIISSFQSSFLRLICTVILTTLSTLIVIGVVGLTEEERTGIIQTIKNKITVRHGSSVR